MSLCNITNDCILHDMMQKQRVITAMKFTENSDQPLLEIGLVNQSDLKVRVVLTIQIHAASAFALLKYNLCSKKTQKREENNRPKGFIKANVTV